VESMDYSYLMTSANAHAHLSRGFQTAGVGGTRDEEEQEQEEELYITRVQTLYS